MRYYEWKQYRDKTVRRLLLKTYNHEFYHDVILLMADIDRLYRFVDYMNASTARTKKNQKIANSYDRFGLDKKWIQHDIYAKLAHLKELLVIMKLGC